MKTDNQTALPRHTEETVLSSRAIDHLECILHWFWDEYDPRGFTDHIMTMLEVYVKNCPKDAHKFRTAEWMTRFVSKSIQFKDQLVEVMEMEKPWEWVDTIDGWRKPEPRGE